VTTNENDSALPIFDSSGWNHSSNSGLSKREYFAALALQGILSSPALNPDEYNPSLNACLAIEAADILIYRLNKINVWEGQQECSDGED
jgi:hypothetical protein